MNLEQVERRLAELRENASPPGLPFDWDDVEYLRLLGRKLELGFASFNAAWFSEMAEKLAATLGQYLPDDSEVQDLIRHQKAVARLWEHLDDIERECTQSEDADATVNSVVDGIEALRKEMKWNL